MNRQEKQRDREILTQSGIALPFYDRGEKLVGALSAVSVGVLLLHVLFTCDILSALFSGAAIWFFFSGYGWARIIRIIFGFWYLLAYTLFFLIGLGKLPFWFVFVFAHLGIYTVMELVFLCGNKDLAYYFTCQAYLRDYKRKHLRPPPADNPRPPPPSVNHWQPPPYHYGQPSPEQYQKPPESGARSPEKYVVNLQKSAEPEQPD